MGQCLKRDVEYIVLFSAQFFLYFSCTIGAVNRGRYRRFTCSEFA